VNNVVTWRADGFSVQKVIAADIMTDGGFESQTAATLADPWWIDSDDGNPPAGTTIEVELATGEAFEGSNNVKFVTETAGAWVAIGQDLTVEENTDYAIVFYLKADNNIYWDGNAAWSKGYMGVIDASDNSLADPYVPRCCDGHDSGAPWAAGELVFGCYDMTDWREYVYLFNSGANTELYLFAGTYVDTIVTWRVDGFSVLKVASDLGIAEGNDGVPGEYALSQNYPNPFNPTTSIHFALPSRGMVKLVVYDLIGQEVRTLAQAPFTSGEHTVAWDGRDNNGELVNSGIYFYRLETGQFNETRKLTFLK
jgi:hypothetical protein